MTTMPLLGIFETRTLTPRPSSFVPLSPCRFPAHHSSSDRSFREFEEEQDDAW